jgi:hypothetical protein
VYSPFKCSQVTSTPSFLKFRSCIASIWKKDFIRKRNPYAFFKHINSEHNLLSFSILLERVGYAYLIREKEVLDRKGKLTCLCFHHV